MHLLSFSFLNPRRPLFWSSSRLGRPHAVGASLSSGHAAILTELTDECGAVVSAASFLSPASVGRVLSRFTGVFCAGLKPFVQDVCGRAEEAVPQSQSGMEAPDNNSSDVDPDLRFNIKPWTESGCSWSENTTSLSCYRLKIEGFKTCLQGVDGALLFHPDKLFFIGDNVTPNPAGKIWWFNLISHTRTNLFILNHSYGLFINLCNPLSNSSSLLLPYKFDTVLWNIRLCCFHCKTNRKH